MIDSNKCSVIVSHSGQSTSVSPPLSVNSKSTPALPPRNQPAPPPLPPRTKQTEGKQTCAADLIALKGLLSPVSESEFEIVKQDVSALAKPSSGSSPPLPPRSKNYYNHMVVGKGEKEDSAGPSSLLCNVYTQTEKDKLVLSGSKLLQRCASSLSTSSFYMDPVDALNALEGGDGKKIAQGTGGTSSKHHSDPELSSVNQSTSQSIDLHQNQRHKSGNDYTLSSGSNWYTMGRHSLESLLEHFKARFPDGSNGGGIYGDYEEFRQNLLQTTQGLKLQQLKEQSEESGKPEVEQSHHDDGSQLVHPLPSGTQGIYTVDQDWQFHRQYNRGDRGGSAGSNSNRTSGSSSKSAATTVDDRLGMTTPQLVVPRVTNVNGPRVNGSEMKTQVAKQDHSVLEQSTKNRHDSMALISRQLLQNDMINFNSFLLNDHGESLHYAVDGDGCLGSTVVGDENYDAVAEDELYGEEFVRLTGDAGTLTRGKASDGVMLNIVYNISHYVFELARQRDNTFAKSVENFIDCTREAMEPKPNAYVLPAFCFELMYSFSFFSLQNLGLRSPIHDGHEELFAQAWRRGIHWRCQA